MWLYQGEEEEEDDDDDDDDDMVMMVNDDGMMTWKTGPLYLCHATLAGPHDRVLRRCSGE